MPSVMLTAAACADYQPLVLRVAVARPFEALVPMQGRAPTTPIWATPGPAGRF